MKLVPRNNGHVQAISYAQHEQCQHGRGMKELETEIFELHDKKPEDVQLAIFLHIVGDENNGGTQHLCVHGSRVL